MFKKKVDQNENSESQSDAVFDSKGTTRTSVATLVVGEASEAVQTLSAHLFIY